MSTKVKKKTFEDEVNAWYKTLTETRNARIALEDQVKTLKNDEEMEARALTRLNRIASMAQYKINPMEWALVQHITAEDNVPVYQQNKSWQKVWEIKTSSLDFTIRLYERTDLKRDKYVVRVTLWHTTLHERPDYINGGYRDTDYGKYKYGETRLTEKFKALANAESRVKGWMKELYEDHKAEFDTERDLLKLCKDTGYKYDEHRRFD
jgi:hypothetical protein